MSAGDFDARSHWREVYATKPETGVSWYQQTPSPSLELLEAAGVTPGSGIVDVGGGASVLVDRLLALGHRDLSVVDISDAALAAARARIGLEADRVEWIAADVTEWRPSRLYDVWHDRAAFHFLTDGKGRQAYVECLRSALRAGGHAIIGTFAPDGPERCSGLPVRRYDAEGLSAAFGPGFRLVDSRRHDHVTPRGTIQHFHFGTLRRAA